MAGARLASLAANPRERNTPLRQLEEYGQLRQALDQSPWRRRIEITQHLTARLEESLRKTSRGGGRNTLVPVAIDDYVYKQWRPESRDLATYVRDLVIADFRKALRSKPEFEKQVDRLVTALAQD